MRTRTLLGAALLASAACTSLASAQLLTYDGFGNGPRADLHGSNGGTGWAGAWSDQTYDAITSIAGPGLFYPGLDLTPGAAVTEVGQGVYPMSSYYRSIGPLPPGTTSVFVSFLLRADEDYGIWGGLKFGTYPAAMYVGSPPGMYSYGLMMSEGLGDISNAPLVQGQTTLVVCKISKNAGSSITYRMYLNPTIGQSEPSFPLAMYTIGGALPTWLIMDNGGGFTTDEVRVGTTWASVLPAEPPCTGDFNNDHLVNASDLAIMLGSWGTPTYDINADGTTNAADLAILLGAWGACP